MSKIHKPAFLLAVLLLTISISSCNSYQPDFNVNDFYTEQYGSIEFLDVDSYVVLMPKNDTPGYFPDTGIIFYPGGAVDYHAYLPLMASCAKKGIACFITKMPLDFALMDRRAAGKFPKLHPEIQNWYMAGHSLGGAMAASYLARHKNEFKGLILLASFATRDFSDSDLRMLSIYGSNDEVLNMDHYQKNYKNFPEKTGGFTEIIIQGGNHAQFGNYGAQKGDGKADISTTEQQEQTVKSIFTWMGLE